MRHNLLDHETRTELIRQALERSGISPGPPHACAYLTGRIARAEAMAGQMAQGTYRSLMDLNFRRSGRIFYRAACEGCNQCRAIRIPVHGFRPNRSQRRCRKANTDVSVHFQRPMPTADKHALYRRYLESRHTGEMTGSWDEYVEFLYSSPINTWEVLFHSGDRLLGVGIIDVEEDVVSTVYCYFEPEEHKRSLGTFNILSMIDYARQNDQSYVYLGYYVEDCDAMNYKARFKPCEVLQPDGTWERWK